MLRQRTAVAAAILLGLLGSVGQASAQKPVAPRGELRIVDPSPLNWASVTLNVFEHLWEFDPDGKLVPRLATSWRWLDQRTLEVKLRQGVKFVTVQASPEWKI
jgi:ABC-type transport system substrate-binding protein